MSMYYDALAPQAAETLQIYPIDDVIQMFAQNFTQEHPLQHGADLEDTLVYREFMSSANTNLGKLHPFIV